MELSSELKNVDRLSILSNSSNFWETWWREFWISELTKINPFKLLYFFIFHTRRGDGCLWTSIYSSFRPSYFEKQICFITTVLHWNINELKNWFNFEFIYNNLLIKANTFFYSIKQNDILHPAEIFLHFIPYINSFGEPIVLNLSFFFCNKMLIPINYRIRM